MKGRYRAYPEYKESGVEWLSIAPVHWSVAPIKYMALEKESLFIDGDWIESKDLAFEGIRYITTGNVGEGKYKEQGVGYITENKFHQIGCTEVFEKDLLISRLNAPIGRACIVPDLNSKIVTSVDNVIFRPDQKYIRKFLVYLFSSKDYFKHTGNLARGATMQRISRGLLGNIRISVPTTKEQTQIANFLDHETAKIDTLIEKQQQLIQLLKEKRQAVISHAVTKGLNPDAPMKDSGVEWIGDIPTHWNIAEIRRFVIEHRQGYYSEKAYDDTGHRVVRITDILEHNVIDTSNSPFFEMDEENRARYELRKGDFLFQRTGSHKKIGLFLSDEPSVYASYLIRFRFDIRLNHRFLLHFLNSKSYKDQLNEQIHGGVNPNIHAENIKVCKLAIPPIPEQKAISDYIQKYILKIEPIILKAESAIQLMSERRTALISAAVTGKIDVRNWKASKQPKSHKEKAA